MVDNIKMCLTEVEAVLSKLEAEYKQRIPKEVWRYIRNNKDKNYIFEWNKSNKTNLHIDTVAILTYINNEYLLDEREKRIMEEIFVLDGELSNC